MKRHLDLIIDLLRRITSVFESNSLSLPVVCSSDSRTVRQCNSEMTAYALGWREALESASKLLQQDHESPDDFGLSKSEYVSYLHAIESLAVHPWPEYPEYGWKSEVESLPTTTQSGSPDYVISIENDPIANPGVFTPVFPVRSLDCQGISLDSTHGKVDSNTSSTLSSSPASSGSDSWTGADDITEGYLV